MSDFSILSSEMDYASPSINIPGHKITWAGEGLRDDRFLFGTDNGIVLECGINGSLKNMHSIRVGEDDESINAISFYYGENALHLAASTRTDIILNTFFVNPVRRQSWRSCFGSHGIKRTLCNYFVAPAGSSGIVVLMPGKGGVIEIQSTPSVEQLGYFYEYATLGLDQDTGAEVSVFACRTDGLAFFYTEPGFGLRIKKVSKVEKQIIDFIGVVSIQTPTQPLAWMALGKGKTLHFMRNPLRKEIIDTLELSFVPGTPYKVLRYGPHAILLTSKGICIVLDVVIQYHRGEFVSGARPVRFIEIEAIDINIAFDKWLLVVTSSGVVKMDLATLLPGADIPDSIKRRMNTDLRELWKSEQETVELQEPVWRETDLEPAMEEAMR
jgi:hypothetical protein